MSVSGFSSVCQQNKSLEFSKVVEFLLIDLVGSPRALGKKEAWDDQPGGEWRPPGGVLSAPPAGNIEKMGLNGENRTEKARFHKNHAPIL